MPKGPLAAFRPITSRTVACGTIQGTSEGTFNFDRSGTGRGRQLPSKQMELIIALTLIAAVITVVFVAIQIRQSDEKSDETETHHAEAQSSRTSMEGTSARTADATEKIADLLAEAPLPPGGTVLSEDDRQLLAALTAAESPTESADSATGYGGDTFFYLSLAEAQFIRHPQLGRDLPVSDSQMRSLIDSGASQLSNGTTRCGASPFGSHALPIRKWPRPLRIETRGFHVLRGVSSHSQ